MKLSLSSSILGALVAPSSLLSVASAQLAVEDVCETAFPHHFDSGDTNVADTVVCHEDAPWIQLDLSRTQLAAGAKVVLTGDAATQELDAGTLAANGYSAVFDGSCVTLALVSPGTQRGKGGGGALRGKAGKLGRAGTGGGGRAQGKSENSRLVVSSLRAGVCDDRDGDPNGQSICGDNDDRVYSNDVRQGWIGGCTGWLVSEDVFIQAGHCGTPSSSTRLHFTNTSASAPIEDQYAVDVASYQGVHGSVGNDWGAGRLLPNPATGLLPGVAQSAKCGGEGCGWYNLGVVPAQAAGINIRITGYGEAEFQTRSQRTSVGALTRIGWSSLSYVADASKGSSGSPVIHEETGDAIGIHTTSFSGCNYGGTRIDNQEFAGHVSFLLSSDPIPAPSLTPLSTRDTAEDIKVNIAADNCSGENAPGK